MHRAANKQLRFNRLLLILVEPSNRTPHKWLLTEIQFNNASSTCTLRTIPKPTRSRALETAQPGTRRVRRENEVVSRLELVVMEMRSFMWFSEMHHACILKVSRVLSKESYCPNWFTLQKLKGIKRIRLRLKYCAEFISLPPGKSIETWFLWHPMYSLD